MVRFSCFNTHIVSHRSKKIAVPSIEAMHKTLEDSSPVQSSKASLNAAKLKTLYLKAEVDSEITGTNKDAGGSFFPEQGWKSKEIKGKNIENDAAVHQRSLFKKSQSLGSELCQEGRIPYNNDIEDEIDRELSSDSGPHSTIYQEVSPDIQQEDVPRSEYVQVGSDLVNNKSIFSIEDTLRSEKEGPENYETLSGENANDTCNQTPCSPPVIVKSLSLPNFELFSPRGSHKHLTPLSRSCEDLHVLHKGWRDVSFHDVETQETREEDRNNNVCKTEKIHFENSFDDVCDSYNYSASAKDWIIPVADEVMQENHCQGESSIQQGKDFKIKRIKDWVDDLQHCSPLEETSEFADTNPPANRDSTVINGLTAAKLDNKVTPGMETAKRYISSLGISATTAQLSNHGLAVIPFLSAFVSLRVLNLSGNSIVRITAGSLPRGLHMLNLSKNKISTIEGLRELTRLRVLDLSYNRIFRIGHGLASCSSLKELYLAGNKISEVEGLHRLLKLTILDLRFNKISTAKCLGQLAANYNSLQAISLEGNPAQKNVGDDQLKKYLQSLLPHLIYYNRQPIKVSTLKDAADRSLRLGINAHQSDRGLRSDNKSARKGGHGLSGLRPAPSSSTHVRKSQALVSPKHSRGSRHARLPPTGTKATANHRHHYFDVASKILSARSELSIRRSLSEGNLGAL